MSDDTTDVRTIAPTTEPPPPTPITNVSSVRRKAASVSRQASATVEPYSSYSLTGWRPSILSEIVVVVDDLESDRQDYGSPILPS